MVEALVCHVCFAGTESHPGFDTMRAAAATAKEPQFAAGAGADDAAALKKLAKQAGDAAQLLKMLANEKRLLILCFLAVRGEMTVGELVGVVKLSQSALSQHLAKLRADGLVEFRRTSQTLHYRVADERALRLLQVLKEIYCGELK
jgi:ArsR family transcriptional regulator, virulence genes transcriptional regulator